MGLLKREDFIPASIYDFKTCSVEQFSSEWLYIPIRNQSIILGFIPPTWAYLPLNRSIERSNTPEVRNNVTTLA